MSATTVSFSWLFYWTGRFYKESYFSRFQIPYEMLGFNTWYYIYSSWVTVIVALGVFFFILDLIAIIIAVFTQSRIKLQIILSIILFIAIIVIFIFPVKFSPQSFHKTVLASKDVVIMISILPSLIILGLILKIITERIQTIIKQVIAWFPSTRDLKILFLVGLFAIAFMFLALVANCVGTYHAISAIRDGKMSIKGLTIDNKQWLYVVRTEDGRNFIYNKEERVAKILKDEEITELMEFDHDLK